MSVLVCVFGVAGYLPSELQRMLHKAGLLREDISCNHKDHPMSCDAC